MRFPPLAPKLLFLLAAISRSHAAPIDVLCQNRFAVTEGSDTLYARYCSNVNLSEKDSSITNAIIVIHGSSGNADDYLRYVDDAGDLTDGVVYDNTAIVAPQFITDEDIDAFNLDSSDNLYWSERGWKKGNTSNSSPYSRPFTISSFAIIDGMISYLTATAYPNLSQITLVGHSAGGQFVHRYAAGGDGEDLQSASGIAFQYVVANPSSYLYFSENRAEEATIGTNNIVFSLPDASTHDYSTTECPDWNDYKHGLDGLNNYMSAVGVVTLALNYNGRTVVVFLGDADTQRTSSLDTTCKGDLQGDNRYERGITFYHHALEEFGQQLSARHTVKVAPGIGHSGSGMMQSDCGLLLLFDYDPTNNACPDYIVGTSSPTASPVHTGVPMTATPTVQPTPSPTDACETGPSCSPNCCVGESCTRDSDCQLNDCSGGPPSSRVCLGPAGPTPSPGPPTTPSPTASCTAKNQPCSAPSECCNGTCKNNGKCN